MNNISKSIYKAYDKLPKFLILAGLYNILFQYIGFNYVYIIFYALGIIWALTRKISNPHGINILVLIYLMFLVIFTFITTILHQENAEIILISSYIYILPVLFWFLYFNTHQTYDFFNLILSLKIHVLIISVLGLIQYYISPDLFGIISSTSNNIMWAVENEEYRSFFRSTSILGSPQVYGAFLSLYILLFIFANKDKNNKINKKDILYLVFLFIAGAHSANKSFFAVLIIYFLYIFSKKKYFFQALFLIGIIITFTYQYLSSIPFLQRIFFNNEIIQSESLRVEIWENAILNAKIIGDGPGSWSNSSFNMGNQVVESYFLQILAELGFITFILFGIIMVTNLIRIRKTNLFLSCVACLFIMFIVHVYNSPAFILFWGVCLYGLNYNILSKNEKITSIKYHS